MLATDPRMQDIDTDQWRRLQSLFTISAKARPRIVVIHDAGALCKLAHSAGERVVGEVDTVGDPAALARRLYDDNADRADFVMVLERSAVDAYYARLQDSWRSDEDLDAYVARSFALMDDFPDGIVTHPGPARRQLGLQYRFGADRATLLETAERYVAPGSSVVLLILDEGRLWAGLVLGFDREGKVARITTAPADAGSEVTLSGVVRRVSADDGPVSFSALINRDAAGQVLAEGVTASRLRDLMGENAFTVQSDSPQLSRLLGADPPHS